MSALVVWASLVSTVLHVSVFPVLNCVSNLHWPGTEVCVIGVVQAQTARPIPMNVPPTRA